MRWKYTINFDLKWWIYFSCQFVSLKANFMGNEASLWSSGKNRIWHVNSTTIAAYWSDTVFQKANYFCPQPPVKIRMKLSWPIYWPDNLPETTLMLISVTGFGRMRFACPPLVEPDVVCLSTPSRNFIHCPYFG